MQSNCKMETSMNPEKVVAYQLTGGYIDYLRKGLDTGNLVVPEVPEEVFDRIGALADFVEYMRARPSSSQEEVASKAMATRIAGQLIKLSQFLAVVYQTPEIGPKVMRVVEKVAWDTADGRTLNIVRALDGAGNFGLTLPSVAALTRETTWKETKYLDFLVKLKCVERFEDGKPGLKGQVRYRLDPEFRKLYRKVKGKA